MKIYVLNNEENYLMEMKNKGFRDDVFVLIEDKYYKMYLCDKTRLIQDYELSILTMGAYIPEPNMLIVEKITNEKIIEIIKICYEEDYFEYLKPCKLHMNGEIEYMFSDTRSKTLKDNGLQYTIQISDLILIYDDKTK